MKKIMVESDVVFIFEGETYSLEGLEELAAPFKEGRVGGRIVRALNFVDADMKKVLDVGCGIGGVSYLIAKRFPDCEVTGIDLLAENVRIAETVFKLPNLRFKTHDLMEDKFAANEFDCILLFEVLEHVENAGRLLTELHRITKPNGCLFASTPNALSWFNHARHSLQDLRARLERVKDEPKNTGTQNDHVASYDVLTLVRLLDRNSFLFEEFAFVDGVGSLSKTIIVKVRKAILND